MATQLSFLIEIEPGADLGGGEVRGRIEHVAWGDRGRFESLVELLDFMSRALRPFEETDRAWTNRRVVP